MVNKVKTVFICTECGASHYKWSGRCEECGAWNTLVEEKVQVRKKGVPSKSKQSLQPLMSGELRPRKRIATGIDEFDRVLGGGFVEGSIVLVGGQPGIGKSTIILEVSGQLQNGTVLYFSGEESESQIKMRANRLGITSENIYISCENNLENILTHIDSQKPGAVVVDSVQTLYSDEFENVPGSITQVRECAGRLLRKAKELAIVVVLIGHITKGGLIAGPKVLEHLVDTVLYLEGDKNNFYRILRSVKNRFGSTNEVGIFEMKQEGLIPVKNPSQLFLTERSEHTPGSAIIISMEGTRPFLIEIQALVTQSSYGTPQRTVNGMDYRRLSMLTAVLEKRVGLPLGTQDVFVNLVGGMRIEEPAIDLGVVAALTSSFKNVPLNPTCAMIGEVGLVGEVRSVPFIEQRVNEAAKLGYDPIYLPKMNKRAMKSKTDVNLVGVHSVNQLLSICFKG